MSKKLLAVLFLFSLPCALFPQSGEADAGPRLMVKFKAGSEALAQARSAVPLEYGRDALLADARVAKLAGSFKGLRMTAIRAVRPTQGTEPPAGGIERIFVLRLATGIDAAAAAAELGRRSDVEYAEQDHVAYKVGGFEPLAVAPDPNDPYFSLQWSLKNTGQTISSSGGVSSTGKSGADIAALAAWGITTGSRGLTMAILDSGIALASEEFSGRLAAGYNFVAENTNVADDDGHGTSVAAIAAANGENGKAIAGLDWKCQIMPIKVIDQSGSALYSNVTSGISYAVDHGARIINMSLAGNQPDSAMQETINYAYSRGVILVAATGNENTSSARYPAAMKNVIAVGATNSRDGRAAPFSCPEVAGSNYGSYIDFVAPGDFLVTFATADTSALSLACGTSAAAPLVSATISLMLAANPGLNADQIYSLLKSGARDQVGSTTEDTPGWDQYFGWGRIDAGRSVEQAQGKNLFSHIAVGNGFTTDFTFVNTGSSAVSGNLALIDTAGKPLDATLTGPQKGEAAPDSADASSKSFTVPSGGVATISATSPSAGFYSSGWALNQASSGLLGGVATFKLYSGNTLTTIAGVLSAPTVEAATIPIDDNVPENRYTGYAVANPSTMDTIVIRLRTVNSDGTTSAPAAALAPITLKPGEQKAAFVFQDPAAARTFKGSLVLTEQNGGKFLVVALVQNQGLYTAIPVIASKAPGIN
jgi:hypothetical protein